MAPRLGELAPRGQREPGGGIHATYGPLFSSAQFNPALPVCLSLLPSIVCQSRGELDSSPIRPIEQRRHGKQHLDHAPLPPPAPPPPQPPSSTSSSSSRRRLPHLPNKAESGRVVRKKGERDGLWKLPLQYWSGGAPRVEQQQKESDPEKQLILSLFRCIFLV